MRHTLPQLARRAWHRLHALRRSATLDRDHDDEVRFHLECEAEELVRRLGLPPEEAHRRALVAFRGVTQTREAHRDARGVTTIETLARDVQYALRTLCRAKTFSLSATLVLALGIGASTAIFAAVHAVVLSRLPYPDDARLVRVFLQTPVGSRFPLSAVDARAIATQARTLSSFGVARERGVAISFGREPEQVSGGFADAGFFRALAVRTTLGRPIIPDDNTPGAIPVVVIGDRLAVHAFGSPRAALGRTIAVDDTPYTIVGVLPRGVTDLAGVRASLWTALQDASPTQRGPFNLVAIGRLGDGATLDGARRELDDISRRVFPTWASTFQDSTATYAPVPLRAVILGRAPDTLGMLAAAVALVLLIVIANVANLTFVRAVGRRRELTLRQTLGAGRVRVARLLVTESIVLAAVGGVFGVILGAAGLRMIALVAPVMPRLETARIDLDAAGFAVLIAIVCGAAIGTLPALLLLHGSITRPTADDSRTVSQGRGTLALQGAFVAGQFALALPLLAGAGLLLNSFVRLQHVYAGFDPAHVLTVRLSLPDAHYGSDSTIRQFWTRALARVADLPGIEAVGVNTAVPPLDPNVCCNNFNLVDHPVPRGTTQPASPWMLASTDYFAALGLHLEEGRAFTRGDTGVRPVVAVSESWARHYFPEGNVLGRRLIQGGCVTCPVTTVVAVVGNAKYMGLDGGTDAVYSPISEAWSFARSAVLFVRTGGTPRDAIPAVRAALRSLDPMLPLDDVAPLAVRRAEALATPRNLASLVGGFAVVALLLAAIGIFGMLSYAVRTRRRELGIRVALGAPPTSVVRMVVRGGMAHAGAGAAVGLVVTLLGIGRLVRLTSGLFEVRPTDPATLVGVACVLLGVALVASLLPALRAARADPLAAIRAE